MGHCWHFIVLEDLARCDPGIYVLHILQAGLLGVQVPGPHFVGSKVDCQQHDPKSLAWTEQWTSGPIRSPRLECSVHSQLCWHPEAMLVWIRC